MLSQPQLDRLREVASYLDDLTDSTDFDDERVQEVALDTGDLQEIIETWQFMYEVLRSTGFFKSVRADVVV